MAHKDALSYLVPFRRAWAEGLAVRAATPGVPEHSVPGATSKQDALSTPRKMSEYQVVQLYKRLRTREVYASF